jgi:hypothetical protein
VGQVEPDEIPTLIRQIARDTAKVDVAKADCIKETWERNQFAISIKSFAASRFLCCNCLADLEGGNSAGSLPSKCAGDQQNRRCGY